MAKGIIFLYAKAELGRRKTRRIKVIKKPRVVQGGGESPCAAEVVFKRRKNPTGPKGE